MDIIRLNREQAEALIDSLYEARMLHSRRLHDEDHKHHDPKIEAGLIETRMRIISDIESLIDAVECQLGGPSPRINQE